MGRVGRRDTFLLSSPTRSGIQGLCSCPFTLFTPQKRSLDSRLKMSGMTDWREAPFFPFGCRILENGLE